MHVTFLVHSMSFMKQLNQEVWRTIYLINTNLYYVLGYFIDLEKFKYYIKSI